ncbi:MAG: beta-lactamase family protein [Candidatus Heimdallarchaeota archaeon]|nr:beta-lactamase family protein [Candidatus Heimdallarchaeota archaeon]
MSSENGKYSDFIEKIDEKTTLLMNKHQIVGLSIALIREGKIVWTKGYGIRNKEKQLPVTTETIFEAASLTKPVVAYVTLKMYEENIIDINKPLSSYLTEPYVENQPMLNQITAKHVLSHITGFPNWGKKRLSPKIFFTPGERFSYSGEGYMYLQKVLEEITGHSLEEILQERILKPLGIEKASLLWNDEYEETAALGYFKDGKLKKKWKPTEPEAAGSLNISPTDFAKFVILMMNQSKEEEFHLKKKLLDKMLNPFTTVNDAGLSGKHAVPYSQITESESVFWSLGWGLEKVGLNYSFWHWGDNGGFKNLIFANPSEKSGVVIMSNSERFPLCWRELLYLTMKGDHPGFEWLMTSYWD